MIDNPWTYFLDKDIKKLKKELHPDKHGATKESQRIFAEMIAAYELSLKPQPEVCGIKVLRELTRGDLRTTYRTDTGVVKKLIVNNNSARFLLKKEKSLLCALAEDKYYGRYFPKIKDLDGGTLETAEQRMYSLQDVQQNYPEGLCGRHIGWILRRFLVGLGFAHKNNICHNAVYPEHMLISENHGGVLTGWIHAEKTGSPIKVVSFKRKKWYSQKVSSPRQDISLLGKSIESVMAVDVPKRIRNFVKGLQYHIPDAWTLEEEIRDILSVEYGQPKFVPINISNLK